MTRRIIFCAVALATASMSLAADKEVEELLLAMRKAYKEVKTATFTLEATILAENGDITIKMAGGFKSPNKMYVDVESMENTARISTDGKDIFAVSDKSTSVFTRKFTNDDMGQFLRYANLEVINFYDWKRQLSTAKGDNMHDSKLSIRRNQKWIGKTWIVLEEAAPTVGVYVEYYVDPETHLVWRTVRMSLDKEFTQGDFILKSLKTGVKIDDSKFKKPVIAE